MTEQSKPLEEKRRETIETYNRSADALAGKFDSLGARIADIDETFALIPHVNPKVLEIGSGNGRDAQEILKRTSDYLGVDISSELVRLAQEKNPGARFEVADISSFEFPKEVDIVFAFASLIHLNQDELRSVFQKILNSLQTTGVARISMKYADQYTEVTNTDEFGTRTYYHYSDSEVIRLAPGFEVVKNVIAQRGEQKWLELILRKV